MLRFSFEINKINAFSALTQTTALVTNLGKNFLDKATATPINASLPKLPITLRNVLPRNLFY